jgi:hypothetical protein
MLVKTRASYQISDSGRHQDTEQYLREWTYIYMTWSIGMESYRPVQE